MLYRLPYLSCRSRCYHTLISTLINNETWQTSHLPRLRLLTQCYLYLRTVSAAIISHDFICCVLRGNIMFPVCLPLLLQTKHVYSRSMCMDHMHVLTMWCAIKCEISCLFLEPWTALTASWPETQTGADAAVIMMNGRRKACHCFLSAW